MGEGPDVVAGRARPEDPRGKGCPAQVVMR